MAATGRRGRSAAPSPKGGGRARPLDDDEAARVLALVRQLGSTLADLGLADVEVQWRDVSVRVSRAATGAGVPLLAGAPAIAPADTAVTAATPDPSGGLLAVEAPMVGTFYRGAAPTAEPYAREDDLVKPGQILCIIEAMKLMNEIESKVAGRIVKVLVENGQGVEYGQPLFLIDPRL
jgi:acetyl-CoA carboxylase biotin carboxyl carrier protein